MKWLRCILFKFKCWHWRFMMKEYQFEKTTLPPLSAENTVKVLAKKYRKKDENDPSSELEEVIQIIFPNGEMEELFATENNLKYAAALKDDIDKKPKLRI